VSKEKKTKSTFIFLMSCYEHPYAQSGTVLDCLKPAAGYNQPSFSLAPRCGAVQPDCNNLTYSAFATDASYNGFYDACMVADPNPSSCDLRLVTAAPKTVIDCWKGCCDKSMTNCSEQCHTDCVVKKNDPGKK
jgi:hypothetical protein